MRERVRGRLATCRPAIEQAVQTRIFAVDAPRGVDDPEYVLGLEAAVRAGVSYGLSALELRGERTAPIPPELLSQARRAACSGVGLDTVLRRCVAGHILLEDFVVREAAAAGAGGLDLAQEILRASGTLLDRLIGVVAAEYDGALEAHSRLRPSRQRQADCAKRLLAGEPADPGELGYELAGWHLAAVISGTRAEAVSELAKQLDCQALVIPRPEGALWAWFSDLRRPEPGWVERHLAAGLPMEARVAVGEPGKGLGGWRLSHLQAGAAWPIALRRSGVVRYAEVAILAAVLRDEVLTRSLREIYLAPLAAQRDGGEVSRRTLRAYLGNGCSVSSAASTLGVNRNTVTSRLRAIEAAIARPLLSCAAELESALRLAELDALPGAVQQASR